MTGGWRGATPQRSTIVQPLNFTTMKDYAFNVIDAINREGIGNESWGLAEDVANTATYFGTDEDMILTGKWAYVYEDRDEPQPFINKYTPTTVLHIADSRTVLKLYRLD